MTRTKTDRPGRTLSFRECVSLLLERHDPNSGLYYYGYRWYDPNLQRWLNRDPLGEGGGINLYGFVRNDPVDFIDRDGLDIYRIRYLDWPHHEGIIGDNPDGGFWYTDFTPTGGRAITAAGQYGYTPKWGFPPDKLPEGLKVTCRVKTTPDVDKALRDKAAQDSLSTPPRYWCLGRNCWAYAEMVRECR